MSISIQGIRPATSADWDSIWHECDYSTYFHSREWAEIWNAYTKGKMKPDPKLVTFTDGKQALLPLSYRRSLKGLVKEYISSPGGTFGGWISTDALDREHAVLLAEFMTRRLGNLFWRTNPYDELASNLEMQDTEDDETRVLNLEIGFDAIYKSWTKGHRSAATKARREGVSTRIAHTVEDWHAYYDIYQDSLRRWGDKATSRYGWELFQEMSQRDSPNIKLWLAIYEDKVVTGALIFYAKKHVVYWHGASLEEYFNLRPVNLLIYEAVKNACEQAYSWFDFNPSGGHEGARAFKKSFGAKPLSCPVVRLQTTWAGIVKSLRHVKGRVRL